MNKKEPWITQRCCAQCYNLVGQKNYCLYKGIDIDVKDGIALAKDCEGWRDISEVDNDE